YFDLASVRLAFACCTSAALTAGSSLTSTAFFATGRPSSKPIVTTRPATSGRSVTDSSERRLPTAVIICGIDAVEAVTASTTTADAATPLSDPGVAAPDADLAAVPERCCPNQ